MSYGGVSRSPEPRRQIASKSDPHFASNCDPLWRARSCVRSRGFGENGAVGKWPAGATVESLA